MKMSVLLVASLLVVGASAIFALGPRILIYPAAWAAVGAIFLAWNTAIGSSKSTSDESSSVVSQDTATATTAERDESQSSTTPRQAASA